MSVIPQEKEKLPFFLLDNALYNLEIQNDYLQAKCIKTKQSFSLPLSTLNKSIKVDDVISIKCDVDRWMSGQDGPLLEYSVFRNYFSSSWSSCFSLSIHYWVKMENHCRKLETVKLKTFDDNFCEEWRRKIDDKVKDCIKQSGKLRPQNLLVFVNPYAGKKAAKSIYKNVVSPLMEKAEIEVTVVLTERSGHATEYFESCDLSEYDGVVAIGGDGTFNEILNGVLLNEQRKRDIVLDSQNADVTKEITFNKPPIRLGLIPAGSGNVLNYTTQGTNDVETATLHIICGESHPLDVTSVYDDRGKFIAFSTLGLNYGLYSEMFQLSEKMRLLGPIRYKMASALLLIKFRNYPGEISFLPSSDDPIDIESEKFACRYPCSTCLKPQNTSEDDTVFQKNVQRREIRNPGYDKNVGSDVDLNIDSSPVKITDTNESGEKKEDGHHSSGCSSTKSRESNGWQISSGPFNMITLMNTACIYESSPNGFVPSAHLADGTNDLILVQKITRRDLLNYSKAGAGPGKHFDFPFIETHRVKAVRFRALPKNELKSLSHEDSEIKDSPFVTSQTASQKVDDYSQSLKPGCWVIDGELFDNLDLTAWVHKGLINIFSKGLEID